MSNSAMQWFPASEILWLQIVLLLFGIAFLDKKVMVSCPLGRPPDTSIGETMN